MARYAIAGLRVASERSIPGLIERAEDASSEWDVAIRWGAVPPALQGAVKFENGERNDTEVLLSVPDVGRFLISNGVAIVVEPEPTVDDREIGIALAGTAFGVLCHQRAIVPLHACSIDVPGGCVAFFGPSRAGKSSLAAALSMQGYDVLSDDVCYLRSAEENVLVWPGVGQVRLFNDVVEALQFKGLGIRKEPSGRNKYLITIPQAPEPYSPRPLRALFRLWNVDAGEPVSMTRISGSEAVELLVPNVYRLALATEMGLMPSTFAMCSKLANRVPVYRLMKPMSLERLPEVVARIGELLPDVLSASR
jgi:hypothetical protein